MRFGVVSDLPLAQAEEELLAMSSSSVRCPGLYAKIKQRNNYRSRRLRKEEKLLASKDDLRHTDSQHSDFAELTEF